MLTLEYNNESEGKNKVMKEPLTGLSSAEPARRLAQEAESRADGQMTKTRGQILRENVFTLFNFLNFLIAGLLFAVGAYSNMLFIAIIILNSIMGTAQELKAKKMVDELSNLNRPKVCVRRDGKDMLVDKDEVVKDDLMVLEGGHQI